MKKLQPYQKISTQEELDTLLDINKAPLECFIMLNFGLRSSKDISFNEDGNYCVFNEIDDSEEIIDHSTFLESFIGQAMTKGALYKY